ncbi:MAG: hypothetical protein ACP5TL_01170 [Candidatus Micrarchaeia archaeon]
MFLTKQSSTENNEHSKYLRREVNAIAGALSMTLSAPFLALDFARPKVLENNPWFAVPIVTFVIGITLLTLYGDTLSIEENKQRSAKA